MKRRIHQSHLSALAGLLVMTSSQSEARMGYTIEQCQEKYGKIVSSNHAGRFKLHTFHASGFKVIAIFREEDEVIEMSYESLDHKAPLTETEAKELLERNVSRQKWKRESFEGRVQWSSDEGWYGTLDTKTGTLIIESVA